MQTPVILIVEDEDVTRLNLVSLFEAEGYKVIEAIDGDDMHDKLTNNDDVNLVVMDINLPGKNGLILARELRQKRKVGLIFLTGRDNDVDRILGLEIGADDYITKPFNPRELTIRARNLITRTGLSDDESALETNGVITPDDAIALASEFYKISYSLSLILMSQKFSKINQLLKNYLLIPIFLKRLKSLNYL